MLKTELPQSLSEGSPPTPERFMGGENKLRNETILLESDYIKCYGYNKMYRN